MKTGYKNIILLANKSMNRKSRYYRRRSVRKLKGMTMMKMSTEYNIPAEYDC